jgi:hypothetical protein
MKNTLLVVLSFGLAMAGESKTMTGWISDATCGAGNAGAAQAQRDCAKRCLGEGEAAVFVSDGDQKVYKLANAPQAKEHLKTKVRVTGTVEGETLKVSKLEDAGQ